MIKLSVLYYPWQGANRANKEVRFRLDYVIKQDKKYNQIKTKNKQTKKTNQTNKKNSSANLQVRTCNMKWSIEAAVVIRDNIQQPPRPQ